MSTMNFVPLMKCIPNGCWDLYSDTVAVVVVVVAADAAAVGEFAVVADDYLEELSKH